MERKKQKLKPHYLVAIILGLAAGPILFNWFVNLPIIRLSPNEYANAYLSPYPISEKYQMLFNERTFCEDVINNEPDLFYERSIGFLISRILDTPFQSTHCPDEFYEKLPEVVFQQILDDDLSEWTARYIDYDIQVNGNEMDYSKIVYHFHQPTIYDDEQRYYHRQIEYWNYLDWIDIHDYVTSNETYDVNRYVEKREISKSQALEIANENGGQDFVQENDLIYYSIKIAYGSHDNFWYVEYQADNTSPCLEITIDAISGEVINAAIE